jgi:two-component system LytT family sensor kinase
VLQPIVENAVKHGIATLRLGGQVRVRASVERSDAAAAVLSLVVEDTGAGATPDALKQGRESGVGLRNVERRLACQYGEAASLAVRTAPGLGTTVEIRLPVEAKTFERELQGVSQ